MQYRAARMAAGFRQLDWYALPRYYDIVFDGRTEREVAFLEGVLARHGQARTSRVLEPACGSGRLVAALARRGYRVTGFDASDAMVAYARKRAARWSERVRLEVARMESFRSRQRFDLAHCLVSSFKYLLCERDARAHLASIAASLAPGGVYALGFHLTDYEDRSADRERHRGSRGGIDVVCNIASRPPDRRRRREALRSRLVVRRAGAIERYETHWEFRTYSARQFRATLRAVPELEHVATYDFHYDLDREVRFGGDQLDQVVILRRRPPAG
jgi:SAM-dependent methyltransferase